MACCRSRTRTGSTTGSFATWRALRTLGARARRARVAGARIGGGGAMRRRRRRSLSALGRDATTLEGDGDGKEKGDDDDEEEFSSNVGFITPRLSAIAPRLSRPHLLQHPDVILPSPVL
eukprot:9468895-Pyramimonas_sp.AAC.1